MITCRNQFTEMPARGFHDLLLEVFNEYRPEFLVIIILSF